KSGHRPVPVDEQGFRAVWDALTKEDLDGSFIRRARAAKDSFGYHIAFSFDTAGTDRHARTTPASTGTSDSALELNVYDDRESVAFIARRDGSIASCRLIGRTAGRNGAALEWLAGDTFLGTLGERKLLSRGNRCLETAPAARAVRS